MSVRFGIKFLQKLDVLNAYASNKTIVMSMKLHPQARSALANPR
jgi:hypothetical protein